MTNGEKVTVNNGVLNVPDHVAIPYIIGDGTGPDIWNAASRVLEAAVEKAYDGKRKLVWKEVLAGEKASLDLYSTGFASGPPTGSRTPITTPLCLSA